MLKTVLHKYIQYDAKLLKLQKQTSKAQTTQPSTSVNNDIFRRVYRNYTRNCCTVDCVVKLSYKLLDFDTETSECEGGVRAGGFLAEEKSAGAGETAQPRLKET